MASESPYLATEYSYYQGNPFIEFKILRQGEGIGPSGTKEVKWLVEPALFDLSSALIKGTVDSTAYWTDMLKSYATLAVPVCVLTAFGHKDDGICIYFIFEGVVFNMDMLRRITVKLQVLKQRTMFECIAFYHCQK